MEKNNKEKVVVFGYSEDPERYSFKAASLLKGHDHDVVTFNPRVQSTSDLPASCDTVTMYVGPAISLKFKDPLLKIDFKRIIFNPGSENPELEREIAKMGREVIEGCTLVMLKTGQF